MSGIDDILAVADMAPGAISAARADGGVVVRSDEVTLRIHATDAGWRVDKQWRDQDRGTAFRSGTVDDVVRYLLSLLANDIRQAHGLPPLRRKLNVDEDGVAVPTDGFSLTTDPGAGFILSKETPDTGRFFASDLEAAKFSYFADENIETLRTHLLQGA